VETPEFRFDGPKDAPRIIALAHGAGAGMDAPFMAYFAENLAARGFRVARFEFPYMAKRRETGKKSPPDRTPVLLETWMRVIGELGPESLIISGKSMGGRMASMVADEAGVLGLVCLGYPFHAPGRPESARVEHLENLATPALILQGDRDPFGTCSEVPGYKLSPHIRVAWLQDGEHSFKPRKASGRTEGENWDLAIAEFAEFADGL